MDSQKTEVEVSFESHPPIDDDVDGIGTLLRQTLLQYTECYELAKHLIELKDVTQIIALEAPDEENTSDEEEPDNDIYGVSSVVELPINDKKSSETSQINARRQLLKFLKDKCPKFKELLESTETDNLKIGLIINERYINLPAQLALPTLKDLTKSLDEAHFTHLVFISKILLRSREASTKIPSKKRKSGQSSAPDEPSQPILFVNPEEEVISEGAEYFVDVDVSSQCDENATWSFNSDVKYIPHRRIMIVDYKKWHKIMDELEKELK